MAWKDIAAAACYDRPAVTDGAPSPGATLFVPFGLAPGESKTIALRLAWYAGQTNLRAGKDADRGASSEKPSTLNSQPSTFYRPWYAGRFKDIAEVADYWRDRYDELRRNSRRFSDCFYDTTLPPEVIDAVAANLTILKSPTVLRQADGRLWAWEGCNDTAGCCAGSCTHVWNYAQAVPHLFPALERTLRDLDLLQVGEVLRDHHALARGRPVVHLVGIAGHRPPPRARSLGDPRLDRSTEATPS